MGKDKLRMKKPVGYKIPLEITRKVPKGCVLRPGDTFKQNGATYKVDSVDGTRVAVSKI